MSDFTEIIERYLAIWNEQDPARRRGEIEKVWTEDARYVDPLVVAEGQHAIDATVAAAQQQFPGLEFRLGSPVDTHHDVARFTWELGQAGKEPIVIGFDVAARAADGRLSAVYGFLDKVPSA